MQHRRSFDMTCVHALTHLCPPPIHMNKVVMAPPCGGLSILLGAFLALMKILAHCSGMEKPVAGELFFGILEIRDSRAMHIPKPGNSQ